MTASEFLPAEGYAGDVTPQQAAQWLASGEAVMVDVRSDAEREWVGYVPGAVPLAWKQWPGMVQNAAFDEGIRAAVPAGRKAVLLCRSGVRSVAAARRATELGLEVARAGNEVHFVGNAVPFRLQGMGGANGPYFHQASSFAYALVAKRYRSIWLAMIVHGVEGFFVIMVLAVILGWLP